MKKKKNDDAVFDENDRVVVVVVATNEERVTVPLILRFRSRVKYGLYLSFCVYKSDAKCFRPKDTKNE